MSKKILIIIAAALLTACEEKPLKRDIIEARHVCNESTTDARAEFIKSCLLNANPKSDEEPEDWIRLCQIMAEETYCERLTLKIHQTRDCGVCRFKDARLTVTGNALRSNDSE